MTNRQLAALETRKKLFEAAKEIICEKGLVNTSISEITNACGVANGTFYTYFKRKEDIVFALSREMFQEIYEKAQACDCTFMERLRFFIVNFSGYIEKSSLKMCQEWVRNTVDPDLVENENDKTKLQFDINTVEELIRKGVEQAVGDAIRAAEQSLERLGTDSIDLMLLHQPMGDYINAWRGLEKLYKYGKSAAQVALRWNLQRGVVVIPKTVHADRMKQNITGDRHSKIF